MHAGRWANSLSYYLYDEVIQPYTFGWLTLQVHRYTKASFSF